MTACKAGKAVFSYAHIINSTKFPILRAFEMPTESLP